MNKQAFGRKTSNTQRPRVDRFVLPRATFSEICMRRSLHKCDQEPVDIWHAKHQQHQKYRRYLDEALGLDTLKGQVAKGPSDKIMIDSWPCTPRKKSFLTSADSILDLPAYSYAPFPELLDWSSNNILVAALENNYYMFSWRAQNVTGHGVTSYDIHCCKFDPRGELLLLGSDNMVELHDSAWSKHVRSNSCSCYKVLLGFECSVTACDWSPTGNSFVTGCSRGVITTFNRNALIIGRWVGCAAPILTVKVSPDARYVAAAAVNSSLVHVLVWPSLVYHSSLNSNWIVKTVTWHPWRSALLGVGAATGNMQTTIALWDTPASKLRETGLGHNHYNLDAMLFSHRTGELVLSLWNPELATTNPKTCSQLVVMSDPYTVVDRSGEGRNGFDRVRTMVFSPDGTKLATATADEDLIIWNFLPEDRKKKNTKPRRFSAIPAYLDQITHGFVIR